jgi:hypothetical protein
VDEIVFDDLPLERLEAELTELSAHLAAGECRFLSMLAAYDRREGWREWGCRSCAYWLSWKCGIDVRTAHEKLRVAHALEAFPTIRAAFSAGRLSYSKARALTRIAGPDTEHDLVEMALRATAAHMESIARGYARAERSAERSSTSVDATDPACRRRVDMRDHDDPTLATLIASLTHEEMDTVTRALHAAGDGNSRADALVKMAESFLAHGHGCRRGSDRTLAMITVDENVLDGDDTGTARFVDGPAILPETARRLCCDASFVWLLRGEHGEPVNVSSRHSMPRSLRRMVRARDRGRCRFPGCAETRYTEIHHVQHRAHGGGHTAANLVTLCWFHHRLVHEGGWSLTADSLTGGYVATSPDGLAAHDRVPERSGDHAELRLANEHAGHTMDAGTVVPRWGGESLDLGWAVTSLYYSNHREQWARHLAQASALRAKAHPGLT